MTGQAIEEELASYGLVVALTINILGHYSSVVRPRCGNAAFQSPLM